ncbi:protein GRINL1A isoform X4 [Lates japonicus]|uniref:Protein GRINL1A isoform X4 n=1 Tax=Lates japonicus TaxID=270547 RepID=A0AAD3M4Z8_LATJO|nr:protein GRINL1A isoform X4 [Lates japonicus]
MTFSVKWLRDGSLYRGSSVFNRWRNPGFFHDRIRPKIRSNESRHRLGYSFSFLSELQAKLAAQKLSEGLKISMGSYTPDGGPMAAYREVHDEEPNSPQRKTDPGRPELGKPV